MSSLKLQKLDVSELRRRLSSADGPSYWRSLEELADDPAFRGALQDEFPSLAARWEDPVTRRHMLKLMGASLALIGLDGCFYKKPQGKLVPYPSEPAEIVAGRPLYFATAMPFDGYGKGILALSREGRPVKLEGNPDHPASLGSADIFMQAALLDLYDPDRSRNVTLADQVVQWTQFQNALRQRLGAPRKRFDGVRLLTGTVTSPTLADHIDEFTRKYPGAQWHVHDPIRDGSRGPFSEPVNVIYDLSRAGVILSLDSDFLYRNPGSVRYARQFADGRRVRQGQTTMSRLYVAEGTTTITGSMADHRLPTRPSRIRLIAEMLARQLGAVVPASAITAALSSEETRWIDALADDLMHPPERQSSLVLTGETQPPVVHALVHAINQKLGNIGKTVSYTEPVEAQGGKSLAELTADMQAGRVDTLLILGTNPAYSAPADILFAQALQKLSSEMRDGQYANFTAHLASHVDETSFHCQWHIPRAHWLEAWGDVRAFDGTASIIQPLIAPLHGGRSEWELMESILGRPDRTGLEIIRVHWMKTVPAGEFEQWWMTSLQKGVIDNTAAPRRPPPPLADGIFSERIPTSIEGSEIIFHADPNVWTGEFANNAWLQELPKPFTKLTWDNAVVIGVGTAQKLGGAAGILQDGSRVRITYRGRPLEAPVVLLPGQPDDLITLHLGYGRDRGGQVLLEQDKARGFNAYALRTSDAPWIGPGAQIEAIEGATFLAITRNHHAMSIQPGVPGVAPWLKPEAIAQPGDSPDDLETRNRLIVRTATLEQFKSDPHVIEKLDPADKKPLLSLYPGWNYDHGLQWGMSIDMTACIGCNACVLACQAENNIPVVGKQEVGRQREMHWIRVDGYFAGSLDAPAIYHQPVPCMHCENAPCEYVCPVGATTHSDEGLNEMTYNRCVGTRYCSNNCPYKVRRFNFFLYSDYKTPEAKLLHNPDVTVRSRGVMEKCTYCVQRIDRTRIEMEKQTLDLKEQARKAGSQAERDELLKQADQRGRDIVRNLQTACQQSCPTQAIIFGDIRDPGSDVAKLKKEPTNYGLLTDLTTKPRTTYLARITNPNPSLSADKSPNAENLTPSPGTPGEGRGEGDTEFADKALAPTLSRSTGRGGKGVGARGSLEEHSA